jgi:hypothetical protein
LLASAKSSSAFWIEASSLSRPNSFLIIFIMYPIHS